MLYRSETEYRSVIVTERGWKTVFHYGLDVLDTVLVKRGRYTQIGGDFGTNRSESDNKPCVVNVIGERLSGHAVQNWCLLRLLPLLIVNRVKQPVDEVWLLCMKLREIVEIICAPKVTADQVALLRALIESYLCARRDIFPEKTLKPKHHYTIHNLYCSLDPSSVFGH